jgi:hypothetical protein
VCTIYEVLYDSHCTVYDGTTVIFGHFKKRRKVRLFRNLDVISLVDVKELSQVVLHAYI